MILALLIGLQSASVQQSNDRRTWYQAYADAQKDIQDKNWQKAITDLAVASQRGAPKPGRNVLFYGDVYRDYNPDYYLGIAYANLQRFAEADSAFERVRQAQLINPRDATYAEFTRQAANVKQNLTALAAQGRPTAQNGVPQTPPAPSTAAQNPPVQNPVARNPQVQQPPNVGQIAANRPSPPADNPPASNTVVGQNPNAADAVADRAGAARPPTQVPDKAPIVPRRNPVARPTPQATANAAPVAPPRVVPSVAPGADERTGVLQFFSGDYEAAAASLSALTRSAGASPRAHFYLACAQTALVLTGKAPRTSLDTARAELALARDTGQFAADKRLISPRIAQELRMQP